MTFVYLVKTPPFLLAALFAVATSAFAQSAIHTPILTSADNFRDVAGIAAIYGGTGYANRVAHNGVMRTGVFYRSNALTLSPADLSTVSGLHLARVIDLRMPTEISQKPDMLPDGVSYININIFGDRTTPSLTSSAAAVAHMEGMNRAFVTNAAQRNAFRQALLELAHTDGPILFHCVGGKDRTGWMGAMLESIAGASSETIMQDYLATRLYSAASIADGLNALSASARAVYSPLFSVQSSFLQAGLDQVAADYGTMDNYLTAGLGLAREDIYVLRAKMVRYTTLPGEETLTGNAAQGAGLLNALQDSPLSGHYTDYNNYLQSSVDQGSLGGVESQVGGQIHADAVATMSRLPGQLDDTLRGEVTTPALDVGKNRLWLAGLFGYQKFSARAGAAAASNHDQGLVVGLTHRLAEGFRGYIGIARVDSNGNTASATARTENNLLIAGGRIDFTGSARSYYVDAQILGGVGDYSSERILGGGLGTAKGDSHTDLLGARVLVGTRFAFSRVSLVPEIGVRTTHTTLRNFTETGSELALTVARVTDNQSTGIARLGLELGSLQAGGWTISPRAFAGYERVFASPAVTSEGTVLGYSVSQKSALDTRDLGHAGLELRAGTGHWSFSAGASALVGRGVSCSASTHLNAGYAF